jgi:hypothetical protein
MFPLFCGSRHRKGPQICIEREGKNMYTVFFSLLYLLCYLLFYLNMEKHIIFHKIYSRVSEHNYLIKITFCQILFSKCFQVLIFPQ